MHKNQLFTKSVCVITVCSFLWASVLPYAARAGTLAPLSFSEMYGLAKSGEVEALRASVRRGMNIDVMDSNGDTGLCIAAKRGDAYTYNVFRAAGANPHHPCVQEISDYEEFVQSSSVVPVTSTSREAYSAVGKEEYKISPAVWWTLGGLAVVGGVLAIVLSNSGGGGSKHSGDDSDDHAEDYNSLGAIAATEGNISAKTSSNASSTGNLSVINTNSTYVSNIDLSKDVLSNTEYMNAGLKATKNGKYTNVKGGILQIGSGTAGMIAIGENAQAVNDGFIKAYSYNGTVGMIASEKATATNNAKGVIGSSTTDGVDLNFSGYQSNNEVIGMYADTNSMAVNNGDIRGTATLAVESSGENSSTSTDSGSGLVEYLSPYLGLGDSSKAGSTSAIVGKIIGMKAVILNAGSDVKGQEITLINSADGKIDLSAGDSGTSGTIITVNSVGMGGFLNDNFLNGSDNINRAEVIKLTNDGSISLGYTGKYNAGSSTSLREGTGGIIGMRGDANTTVDNNGTINLVLQDTQTASTDNSSTDSGVETGAGMQSVHGSDLTNNGTIKIYTISTNSLINYGMLSVKGSGTVSGLYTNLDQKLINNKEIIIEASNSYGLASYNSGTLTNSEDAAVVLGNSDVKSDTQYTNNIGMYGSGDGTLVTLNNKGTIDVYSWNSIAMKNDFSGGQTIQNDGIINIKESATNSNVFGGYYSVAVNNGLIDYNITEDGTPSARGTAEDPFAEYSLQIVKSIITTKSDGSSDSSSSSTTEKIYNNAGKTINVNGSSFTSAMSAQTVRGYAENNGTINLNEYLYKTEGNSVGMYMYGDSINFANLINNGTINTESFMSAAMASDSQKNAAIINNGTINTQKEYSLGMYANGKSVMTNNGTININGANSAGIYVTGSSNNSGSDVTNTNAINVGSADNEVLNGYGIYSKAKNNVINNESAINIYTENTGAGIYVTADSDKINNLQNAVIQGKTTYGIYSAGASNIITNKGTISGAGTAIHSAGNTAEINNSGTINGADTAIYSEGDEVTISNNGTIVAQSNGIESSGASAKITNSSTLTVQGTAILSSGEEATISNSGNISAYSDAISSSGDGANISSSGQITSENGNGIAVSGADAVIVNDGNIINSNGTGIYAEGANAQITNNNNIRGHNGIEATQSGANITNNGNIIITSNNGIAINAVADAAAGSSDTGGTTIVNNGIITTKYGYPIYVAVESDTAVLTIENNGVISTQNEYQVFLDKQYTKPKETDTDKEKNIKVSGVDRLGQQYLPDTESTSALKVTMLNNGLMQSLSAFDFNDDEVVYVLGENGTYEAPELSGEVLLDKKILTADFADEYMVENAFVGEDKGIILQSPSYMFAASVEQQPNNVLSAQATRKDFQQLVDNSSLANYLRRNYENKQGEKVFAEMKQIAAEKEFSDYIAQKFAVGFVTNLAKQSLDVEKNINLTAKNNLLQDSEKSERKMVYATAYKQEVGKYHQQSGYTDKVAAAGAFYDKALNNNWRAGWGANIARMYSEFTDNSTRYNNLFEVYAPIIFASNNSKILLQPKIGFARGHYRRSAGDAAYKAQTEEYYYGADIVARQNWNLQYMQVQPVAGFNLTGLYTDYGTESRNGLHLHDENIISAQSVLGADVVKEVTLSASQTVELSLGGRYFHEFGDKYRQKISAPELAGSYELTDGRSKRDFGVLSAGAEYQYDNLSIGFMANKPLENKHHTYYMLNAGWQF